MAQDAYRFGPFLFDASGRRLQRDGRDIPLQPRVFDTLAYLVEHAGRAITKEELIANLWRRRVVTDDVLTRCIKELRHVLRDDARAPLYIRSLPRVGYSFIARLEKHPSTHTPLAIAVLPFGPLVADERDEELELGIPDAIINGLSGIHGVVVRPLAAVRKYVGLDDPLEAGREQHADVVIEGNLQRVKNNLRVTVRVLRVADATALLAQRFDERLEDVFELQDSICRRIVDALALQLSQPESTRLTRHLAQDPAAWHFYLLGRLRVDKHTPEDDRRSIECFERAVEQDGAYALAWAGLADAYESLGTLGAEPGNFVKARECAMRALELDPDLVPALTCLGKISWEHEWDWPAAERHLKRAIAFGPSVAEAHLAYSDFCAYQRRYQEAIASASHALQIDPTSPWVSALLAQSLHMAGRHEEAVAQAKRALTGVPDFAFAHLFLALALVMQGQYADGVAHLEKARALSGRVDLVGALGYAYAMAGKANEARGLLSGLEKEGAPPIVLALVHLGLREDDRALDLLEHAAQQRDWHVLLLHAEPIFTPLRDHPRTLRLLKQMGVAGY